MAVQPTENDARILRRMRVKVDGFSGPGVSNSPNGSSILNTGTRRIIRNESPSFTPFLFFAVGAATATGTNDANGNPVQWTYAVTQVEKDGLGYATWTTVTNGWSGTGYNFLEDSAVSSGRQPNGVDHDGADYLSTYQMQSVQSGTTVPGIIIPVAINGVVTEEAWFWPIVNGEDGTCT